MEVINVTEPVELSITVKQDWESTDTINYDDFNRIETNIKTVRDYLVAIQYAIPSITTKEDRTMSWVDYLSSINRIEQNLEKIRQNFVTPSGYPGTKSWARKMGFDYRDANRLETDIRLLFEAGEKAYESFRYCGTFSCGEDGDIY